MGYLDYGEGSGLELQIEDGNINYITASDKCETVCGENILTIRTFMLVIMFMLVIIYYPGIKY